MSKYFGTDGFRGEANRTLTAEHAYRIGRFLGYEFGEGAQVAIGKDTRRSSYMLEYALAAGLAASGADALLLHVTTTPSVSYVVRSEHLDGGVMISASHNPYYDNGIKLLNRNGEKMEEETLLQIEDYLDGTMGELPFARRENIGRTVDFSMGRNRYIGYLISLATRSYKGKKIGLDCANGSAWMIAKSVFDALGAETHVIHNQPDGFNINRGCGSTHMEDLQRLVVEQGLDVGFAFDGDADRCLCVDEKGQVVDGDKILYIYGRYLKERGKLYGNKIVTTVMSNLGLFKALDRAGIEYEKTAVGDKYVYECMNEHGYRLGGEQSGHIIFKKYATTGDGILTAIKLMEVLLEKREFMSRLAGEVEIYPQMLKNLPVTDKKAVMEDGRVREAVSQAERELGEDGRILVRESGTEPVIRVMAEAQSEEVCRFYVERISAVIESCGYVG